MTTSVLITGANSGLGLAAAINLAPTHDLPLACRNPRKAAEAREEILRIHPLASIRLIPLDTSSLTSVRSAVSLIDDQWPDTELAGLVNNAGISPLHEGVTEEGFELVFATNYLGHFLLTHLLLPRMAPRARIINVTSDMPNPPGGLEWPGVEHLAPPRPPIVGSILTPSWRISTSRTRSLGCWRRSVVAWLSMPSTLA